LIEFIRIVDALEERADPYLSLDEVAEVATAALLERAIAEHVLLVDYRNRLEGAPITLCRLNRRHPLVAEITVW
jgi:hypothetical protein